jgi:hypothetical protein
MIAVGDYGLIYNPLDKPPVFLKSTIPSIGDCVCVFDLPEGKKVVAINEDLLVNTKIQPLDGSPDAAYMIAQRVADP